MLVSAAAAGGQIGYSTGNYVQHAGVGYAGSLGGLGFGGPVGYSGLGGLGYAHAPVATYAAAPVIAKTVVPAAQSTSFVNRAPAARVLVRSHFFQCLDTLDIF
jgi:hypothetical protein